MSWRHRVPQPRTRMPYSWAHGPHPGHGQLADRILDRDIKAKMLLRELSRQQMDEDRTGKALEGEHRVHPTQPAGIALREEVTHQRSQPALKDKLDGLLHVRAGAGDLKEKGAHHTHPAMQPVRHRPGN